ncbi:CvpA family protein [Fretibacter rubidus]|uniref:CvpA family protein n=1 Tax=Fretibacter rubidus TaxID=570162 RepID=UPI00352ADA34
MSIGPWDFTGFDIVVLLVIIISLLIAASRGLFRELISIAALSIAGIASLFVYGRFRFAARDIISPQWLSDAALGLGTFMMTYLLCVFLFSGVVKNLRGKEVGLLDRLAGAGFGVFRGLVVCALATMVFTASYHEAKAAQEFKQSLRNNGTEITDDMLRNAPKSVRDMFLSDDPELPNIVKDSVFFPTLDKIGSFIRGLPFSRMETFADRLKSGENLEDIAKVLENN